jgi:hypothetical protein
MPAPEAPDGLLAATVELCGAYSASDIAPAWAPADLDGLGRPVFYRDERVRMLRF